MAQRHRGAGRGWSVALGLALGGLGLGAPASEACTSTTFSASGDFSATQGSCGWSYRYQPLTSSTFYTMSWVPSNPDAGGKNTWKGNEQYLLLWADGGHPGGAGHAIRRWTAPSAGTVQLVSNGTVRDLDSTCGDGVTVSIKTGPTTLWGPITIANGNTTGVSFRFNTPVTAGQALDFVLSPGASSNNWCDTTAFNPTILRNPPAIGSLTPSSGTSAPGQEVKFTSTTTDPDGWTNLYATRLLVNAALSGTNAAYTLYNQNANLLYLLNDAGTAWLGGCTPGSSTVLSNSQASLACARTTVSGSGTTLTVTWALTFTSAFTGAKRVYLYAQDDTGATAGWTQKGTWTIGKPDLIVARIRPEPFTPKIGDAVRFFATVKNIGSAPVPAGKTINTTFWLPWPNYITYSVDSGQGLAVGMERELPASGTWVATSSVNGTAVTSVFAYADDTWNPNLIDESNESNNGYSQAFAPYRACATPGCPQSFGYYYVGIGDPTYIPTYIQQTAPWSNVSFLNMTWRTTTASDWSLLQQQGVKAIVGIPDLLFRYVGPGNYDLYADYQTRWANFVAANTLGAHLNQVAALYLADEPTLNGLTYDDLRLASLAIKQTFPTLPIALVEGPKGWGLDGLQIPVTVDWVGFDLYRIRDPRTSPAYQDSWTLLKAKRTAKQKLLVILDGFWDPGHQTAGGLSQSDMAVVATNYYSLATNDPDAMGLWPFVWNTFVENGVTLTGTRDLPQNVRDEHRRIGKLITGKP